MEIKLHFSQESTNLTLKEMNIFEESCELLQIKLKESLIKIN